MAILNEKVREALDDIWWELLLYSTILAILFLAAAVLPFVGRFLLVVAFWSWDLAEALIN